MFFRLFRALSNAVLPLYILSACTISIIIVRQNPRIIIIRLVLLWRGNPKKTASGDLDEFETRAEALRHRVGVAARELVDRGIRPTVTRIRAALGGGSPNDLAPALKAWKESSAGIQGAGDGDPTSISGHIPLPIADLATELWHRASTAAAIELRGGSNARHRIVNTFEAESLLIQVTQLREQLQRELIAFGELRAQAARHEAIARDAIRRLDESEARERKSLRDLGTSRQRVTELEATLVQRKRDNRVSAISRRKTRSPARKLAPVPVRPTARDRVMAAKVKTKRIARERGPAAVRKEHQRRTRQVSKRRPRK
jgi:hypothetical protein